MYMLKNIIVYFTWILLTISLFGYFERVQAEDRYALVIGNKSSIYPDQISPANLMSRALVSLDFKTRTFLDITETNLKARINDFTNQLKERKDTVGVFYFSGREAMGIDQRKYLIPSTAYRDQFTDGSQVTEYGIRLDELMARLESAGNVINFVFLDICFGFHHRHDKCLCCSANMRIPHNVVLACSPKLNVEGAQGFGIWSVFTEILSEEILRQGVSADQMLSNVKNQVAKKTSNDKVEIITLSNQGYIDFHFYPPPHPFNVGTGGGGGERAINPDMLIPNFPEEPPRVSGKCEIPDNLLRLSGSNKTNLYDIERRLSSALKSAGYADINYFAYKERGFVIVTQIEQINADGTVMPESKRWDINPSPLREFSIEAFVRALFTAQVGYFRVIAFIVTDSIITQSEGSINRDQAIEWMYIGASRLPNEIGDRIYSRDYSCWAFIYEFKKVDENEKARVVRPGRPAIQHLEKSNILARLRG